MRLGIPKRQYALVCLLLVVGTAGGLVMGYVAGTGQGPAELGATLVEQATNQNPLARVDEYARAIARGDGAAAREIWELPLADQMGDRSDLLAARRERITDQLLKSHIHAGYTVLNQEWWRTCCEPGVISDSRSAGAARLVIQFTDAENRPLVYRFDVLVRGGAYWGAAMGYPARQWALRDIYGDQEQPLFFPYNYIGEVKYLSPF